MILKNAQEVLIEKAKISDAEKIIEYLNIVGGESDNLLFGENEFIMTVEDEQKFINNLSTSTTSALFIGKIHDEIVCVGSIMTSNRKRISHQADLALSVKKSYWNIGIGTSLINQLIDFAKNSEKIEIIHLGVKSDNLSAINLYKKVGFEKIGMHKNYFKFDGYYGDEILMDLYL